MAIWNNGKLILYHGTDDQAFKSTSTVQLGFCRPFTDFGRGFYTTTHLHQAKQWANKRMRSTVGAPRSAMVYKFELDRDELAGLDTLVFVRPTQDFWSFVAACRRARTGLHLKAEDHGRDPNMARNAERVYDVVFGLVTLWPQRLVISDCDQISFHTSDAINLLSLPAPYESPKRGQKYF